MVSECIKMYLSKLTIVNSVVHTCMVMHGCWKVLDFSYLCTFLLASERFLQRFAHQSASLAARQAALLMASAVVVLKHETSTLCQRHNFISIDFKFGVGDYVRDYHIPWQSWFGSDDRSRRHMGATYTSTVIFFYILQLSYSPYPWTNFCAQ